MIPPAIVADLPHGPEAHLLLAVLGQAVADCGRGSPASDRCHAYRYFLARQHRWLCHLLGLDAERVREWVIATHGPACEALLREQRGAA